MAGRILLFTLLALCAFAASAARNDYVRQQVEASMLVTGELVVAPDGSVKSYKLDRADELPPDTQALLAELVPTWQLDVKKADGSPLQAPAMVKMGVQLLARPIPGVDDQLRVTVGDTTFHDPKAPVEIKANEELTPPKYPVHAWRSGMTGIVYVVLRLNPDGSVAETHVQRVDMTVLSNEKTLRKFGRMLADAAVAATKQWTFTIAPERLARPGSISVRVPIAFALSGGNSTTRAKYGQWHAYVPGPYAPIPWHNRTADSGENDDGGIGAMVPNQLYPTDDAPIKLRRPPAGT